MNNFWIKIKNKCKAESRPILAIAPMADVTDVAFRTMLNKYGKPDVTWTEFVSANGLMSPGREILSRDLEYSEMERPVVAQLFTNDPDKMEGAARLCEELGFDGIDINMGCPAGIIIDQGAGAKMITTPELAKEVILAAKRGAPNTPISVKTRLGYNKMEWETWIPNILSCDIVALTVHLRTRKEMSLVPAHYELIDPISELVRRLSPETVFLINGDVKSIQEAKDLYMNHDIDGVMIGRALFGKPEFFDLSGREYSVEDKLEMMLEHTELYINKLGDIKPLSIMKKHFKAYVNNFKGAKELREKLFATNDLKEMKSVIEDFKNNSSLYNENKDDYKDILKKSKISVIVKKFKLFLGLLK